MATLEVPYDLHNLKDVNLIAWIIFLPQFNTKQWDSSSKNKTIPGKCLSHGKDWKSPETYDENLLLLKGRKGLTHFPYIIIHI
jgi:hypothetical protein